MKLILHIGAPKTGTTALQETFSRNRDALRQSGVLYPLAGCRIGSKTISRHVGFRFAFHPLSAPPNGVMGTFNLTSKDAREAYSQAFKNDFDKEIESATGIDQVVVSDEALFVFPHNRMISGLHDFLNERFDEVSVVCHLREPASYLSSSYSQHIKMGGCKGIAEYFGNYLEDGIYSKKLERWGETVGHKNMSVKIYSGDILSDFMQIIGKDFELALPKTAPNRGLSKSGLELLRNLNTAYKENKKTRPANIRKAFEKGATIDPWKIDPDIAKGINAHCSAEIEKISKAYELSSESLAQIQKWKRQDMPDLKQLIEAEGKIQNKFLAELSSIIQKLA